MEKVSFFSQGFFYPEAQKWRIELGEMTKQENEKNTFKCSSVSFTRLISEPVDKKKNVDDGQAQFSYLSILNGNFAGGARQKV